MTRAAILNGIRRGLRRGALPDDQQDMLRSRLAAHPRHIIPARTDLPHAGLLDLLEANIRREFGTLERLPDLAAVPDAVQRYLASQNLPAALVMAPHPDLLGIDWPAHPLLQLRTGAATPQDMVSLQTVFAAIAETGTFMLPSGPDRPTTLNLLPDTEILLLRTSNVVRSYEDGWDRIRNRYGSGHMPRNVMLVSGPSRSADVEQTLELGAHGPRRLHVLMVEDGAGVVG